MIKLSFILLFTCICFGCANNSLTLTLDLYKEDPLLSTPLTAKQITQLYEYTDNIEKNTESILKQRERNLSHLKVAFDKVSSVSPKGNNAKGKFDKFFNDYDAKLQDMSKNVFYDILSVRRSLDKYVQKLYTAVDAKGNTASSRDDRLTDGFAGKDKTLSMLKMVFDAGLVSVRRDYGDFLTFPNGLKNKSDEIRVALLKGQDGKNIKIDDSERYKYKEYFLTMHQLGIKSDGADAKDGTNVGISGYNDEDNYQRKILSDSSFMFSQIDRLQNYADPVWREITSQENNYKWTTRFSETVFYAEGRSEVFIVRDSPATFRVHQGSNNPTSLVQSQLQISRAVGNTALSLAAAATGVKLPFSLPGQTGLPNNIMSNDSDIPKDPSDTKVQLDARMTYGKKIAAYLKDELKSILPEDKLVGSLNGEKLKRFAIRFKSFLAAGQQLLQSVDAEAKRGAPLGSDQIN